jgi:hypothetical protein
MFCSVALSLAGYRVGTCGPAVYAEGFYGESSLIGVGGARHFGRSAVHPLSGHVRTRGTLCRDMVVTEIVKHLMVAHAG